MDLAYRQQTTSRVCWLFGAIFPPQRRWVTTVYMSAGHSEPLHFIGQAGGVSDVLQPQCSSPRYAGTQNSARWFLLSLLSQPRRPAFCTPRAAAAGAPPGTSRPHAIGPSQLPTGRRENQAARAPSAHLTAGRALSRGALAETTVLLWRPPHRAIANTETVGRAVAFLPAAPGYAAYDAAPTGPPTFYCQGVKVSNQISISYDRLTP